MRTPRCLPMCAFVLIAAVAPGHAVPLATPQSPDAALAAKCKAASFARRPAGQMATTMRDMQIQRCIKNNGSFLE